jgi:hypothetical protein
MSEELIRKFQPGDLVQVTDECIKEKVELKASIPFQYFEKNKVYKVKETALYGNADSEHVRVLVEGSYQFVHQDNFVPANLTGLEKYAMKKLNLTFQDIYKQRKIKELELEAIEEAEIYANINISEYENSNGNKIVHFKYSGTHDPVIKLEEAAKYYASKEFDSDKTYSMFVDFGMDNPWELILKEVGDE